MKIEDTVGYEYDWFAVDDGDRVGFFSSAGTGLIPKSFLSQDVDQILSYYQAPFTGTWEFLAGKGLYTYDCEGCFPRYRLQLKPQKSIHILEINEDIAHQITQCKIKGYFEELEVIDEELILNGH